MQTGNASQWDLADTLEGIVSLAWMTFVGSEIVRIDPTNPESDVVCASIAISGPNSATVLFFAGPALARWGTASVLGMEPDEPTDGDVHDVMGELVNIIGGNLKGLVSDDGDWSLTLPVVSNAMQSAPGGRLVSQVAFLAEGGTIGCNILEHG